MAYAGVHLFLANKLNKKHLDSHSYFFGNLIPDVEHLMKPKNKIIIHKKHQGSHHTENEVFLKIFQDHPNLKEGIKTHFLVDRYVHHNYVFPKIKKFKHLADAKLIHFITEIMMDRVLVKQNKNLKKFYNQTTKDLNLNYYGKKLDLVFPESKHKGKDVLKDGIEMLRISNLTSWLRINKARKIVQKYNPFTELNPSIFQLIYLMKKIEKEVKKDLYLFLEKAENELKELI